MEVMRDASLGGGHGCPPRMSERLMMLTHASFYLCFMSSLSMLQFLIWIQNITIY